MVGSDFSEGMLDAGARARAPGVRWEQGNALALPYDGRRVRRRDGRLRRAQLLRSGAGPARDGARGAARAAGSWCSRSPRRRSRRCRRSSRSGSTASCRCWARVTGEDQAYTYLPSSVKRFPGPQALGRRAWPAPGLRRRALDPHRRRHHRPALGDGGLMASAEAVAAVIAAGGAHVPGADGRLEERLQELARSHGPVLAEHAGATIAAGGKRLRPLLVLLAAGPGAGAPRARAAGDGGGRADPLGDARARRRARRAPLRRGRPTVVAAAGRAIATATGDLLFSRAFAELARNGSAGGGARALRRLLGAGRGRAAAARGRVERRRLARALRAALRSEDRAAVPGRLRARRARGDGAASTCSGASGAGSGSRSRCSTTCSTSPGPAERTGKHRGTDLLDGTVTLPLILARERDPELRSLDLRAVRTPAAGRGGVRRDRGDRRAGGRARGRRWRSSAAREGRRCRCCRRPSRGRWSWWPTASSTGYGVAVRRPLEVFGQDRVGVERARRSGRSRPPCSPAGGA